MFDNFYELLMFVFIEWMGFYDMDFVFNIIIVVFVVGYKFVVFFYEFIVDRVLQFMLNRNVDGFVYFIVGYYVNMGFFQIFFFYFMWYFEIFVKLVIFCVVFWYGFLNVW